MALLPAGQPQINEGENGNRAFESIARVPDGGTPLSTGSFQVQSPTPGALNSTPTASVIVAPTGGSTDLTEDGQTDSYSIALSLLPTSDVTVSVMPDGQIDLGAGAGMPVSLTFTSTDGTIPQQLIVAAVDDSDIEGPHVGIISHMATSADLRFNGITIPDVVASIEDNETIPVPEVVISEIMYNPDSDEASPGVAEWVELVNVGSTPVDLSSWRLDDEDSTNWGPIPTGVELQPNEIIVLYDEDFLIETEFRTSWSVPASAQVVGVTWGSLANSPSSTSEILTLLDATTAVQDEVNYDDSGDWPSDNPDGASIYLTDLGSDNNVGINWARSVAGVDDARNPVSPFSVIDEGSPGFVPMSNVPDGDFDNDGDLDCDDIDALVLEAASGNNASEFDLTGDGLVDRADVDDWILNRKGTLIGDANLDFQVDISDFNIWNVNKFLSGTGWCGANFNADFGTDISDFNIWNSNKFTSAIVAPPLGIQAPVSLWSTSQARTVFVSFEVEDAESDEPQFWRSRS
ncbi:MAG: lamin tail domain-containing protein [Planctomycetota bacterium]